MLIVVLSTVNLQDRAVVMFFRPPMIAVCSLQFIAALTDSEGVVEKLENFVNLNVSRVE